jgi:shikimate dehydrogenase
VIINASTPVYALLGHPIGHSLSPTLQNGWIVEHGFDAIYVALNIDPNHFETAVDGLFHAGLKGANVTVPFKERAAAKAIELTQNAKSTGSVNCLSATPNGFRGDSTDGAGFIADLDNRAKGWRDKAGHVVLLGAGGAARAILVALSGAGCRNIHLVNRTYLRGLETAKLLGDIPIRVSAFDDMDRALEGACLVINATSAGLNDQNALTLDLGKTDPDCWVYDTVYAPRKTALLKNARYHKRQTLDGLGMLVGQGALSFENWFGTCPDLASGLARLEAGLTS